MLSSAVPSRAGSKPSPSSWTVASTWPSDAERPTRTERARACFLTFVSVSWRMRRSCAPAIGSRTRPASEGEASSVVAMPVVARNRRR